MTNHVAAVSLKRYGFADPHSAERVGLNKIVDMALGNAPVCGECLHGKNAVQD